MLGKKLKKHKHIRRGKIIILQCEKKQERILASASRSLYTLAAIIIKFKNTKMIFPIE